MSPHRRKRISEKEGERTALKIITKVKNHSKTKQGSVHKLLVSKFLGKKSNIGLSKLTYADSLTVLKSLLCYLQKIDIPAKLKHRNMKLLSSYNVGCAPKNDAEAAKKKKKNEAAQKKKENEAARKIVAGVRIMAAKKKKEKEAAKKKKKENETEATKKKKAQTKIAATFRGMKNRQKVKLMKMAQSGSCAKLGIGTTKEEFKCPPGKNPLTMIKNPMTGVCVQRKGKLGKKLVEYEIIATGKHRQHSSMLLFCRQREKTYKKSNKREEERNH